MTNVQAEGKGGDDSYGVYNENASTVMRDVYAKASEGEKNNTGLFHFSNGTFSAKLDANGLTE
jgi:hypothetical protein